MMTKSSTGKNEEKIRSAESCTESSTGRDSVKICGGVQIEVQIGIKKMRIWRVHREVE